MVTPKYVGIRPRIVHRRDEHIEHRNAIHARGKPRIAVQPRCSSQNRDRRNNNAGKRAAVGCVARCDGDRITRWELIDRGDVDGKREYAFTRRRHGGIGQGDLIGRTAQCRAAVRIKTRSAKARR